MANTNLFNLNAPTLSISVTTSASTSQPLPNSGDSIRFLNEGTVPVYVAVGAGTQAATLPGTSAANANNGSCPIGAGEDASFSIPSDQRYNISAICRTGTALLNVQVGEGQ